MQTRRQSRLEVAVDWLCMLGVNIGGQMVAYGMLATTWRAGTFAAATIILAVPRRYTTRRVFNRFVTPGTGQSHRQSWLEAGTDTLMAFGMSIALQLLWYGATATWATVGGLTLGVYLLTLLRRYILRRVFEWWAHRQVTRVGQSPTPT
jgi:hypothetical protein